jgi:hypothetical protein
MSLAVTSTSDFYRPTEPAKERYRLEGGTFEVTVASPTFGVPLAKTEAARPASVVYRSRAGVIKRVKRKIQGILVSFSGDEALVLFDSDGKGIEYWLPAELLRKNGVTVHDQPFELIESEIIDGHEFILQSSITALATQSSGTIEPLDLQKSYKAKRDFLLKKSKSRAA